MTQSMSDPYKVLGIPRDASRQTAREAYRRLAKQFHPDLADDSAANERMRRINEAWRLLSRPTRRANPTPSAVWHPASGDRARPFPQWPEATSYRRSAPRRPEVQPDTGSVRPVLVVTVGAILVLFGAIVGFVPPLFVILIVLGASRIFRAVD